MKILAWFISRNRLTYRRRLLDRLLTDYEHLITGVVVDIGGERRNQRGVFRVREDRCVRYITVNNDVATRPDILADAANVPLESDMADVVMCMEVLEHVRMPELVCHEMLRILKPKGVAIVSVPFLFPVHADPHDFGRFTSTRLQDCLADFETVQITSMGGWLGTVGMFLDIGSRRIQGRFLGRLLRSFVRSIGEFLVWLELRNTCSPMDSFTTGYYAIARKKCK